nr:MAG TPA: hypothetical protein [Caudoviricetes sp.]
MITSTISILACTDSKGQTFYFICTKRLDLYK